MTEVKVTVQRPNRVLVTSPGPQGPGGSSGVSVTRYGAKGDGVADDYPAIAAAIQSLPGSGGTVVFPPGVYKISQTLTASGREQISLMGEGGQFAAKILAAGNFPVVSGTWRYCRIHNLSLDAGGHGGMGMDVFLDQTDITSVWIGGWNEYGIRVNDWAPTPDTLGWLNRIKDCHITTGTGVGIRTGYRFTDSWIEGCNIGSTLENLNVEGWVCRILNNHLDGYPTHNLILRGNRRVLVTGNIFEHAAQESILYNQPSWDTFDIIESIQITDNIFMNGSLGNKGDYAAIRLNGLSTTERSRGFLIADNTFDVSDGTAGWSYCVDARNCMDLTVVGNLWHDSYEEVAPVNLAQAFAPYSVVGNGGVDTAIGAETSPLTRRVPPVRGVNLSPWATGTALWEEATEELRPTHVTVPIRIETPSTTSSTVTVNASDLARAAAYDPGDSLLIIEPYPWVNSGADSETEWNPTDVAAWETNYTAALVEIAEAFPAAWGMYVGSNLQQIEDETARWINIIDAVKAETPGVQVIYRTNWWTTAVWDAGTQAAFAAKIENPLFDEVDVIAVAAYFELMDTPRPNQDEIADSLYATTLFERFQNVYDECRRLAQRWDKPLLFGELACAKYEGALASPWRPWNPPDVPPPVDWMIQARYFRAVYDTFRDASWWAGFSVYGVAYPYADGGYNLTPAASRWLRETMEA